MKTFPTVEDYLEVLAGKRDLITGVLRPSTWFGHEFKPIVNLARYDTDFLNSVTDSTIGSTALTDRQAELGVKLVLKYQRQLSAKGVSVDPLANPQYRMTVRKIDRSKRIWADGDKVLLKFPYNAKMIEELRELIKTRQGAAAFNKEQKHWEIALSEYNLNFCVAWAQSHEFELDKSVVDLMDMVLAVEAVPYAIELARVDGALTITNAENSLLDYLANVGLELTDEHLIKLADLSSVLGYTVSAELWQEIDQLVTPGVAVFLRSRNYELTGDADQLPRLYKYAQLVNRLPMIVYDPAAEDSYSTYSTMFGDDICKLGNKHNIKDTVHPIVWTHRPVTELGSIPLLISHVGMMVGADKTLMLQNCEKTIYFDYKLK